MKTVTIKDRKRVLKKVRNILIGSLKRKIVCAIVYGSTLNNDFCKHSDFDILIVAKNPDVSFLKNLKEIKNYFLKNEKVKIDFNVHKDTDVPKIRKEVFWHNNRGIYVQKEFELYGKVLIGKNIFNSKNINVDKLLPEAVKVINSLNYQARKLLINSDWAFDKKLLLIKWCIYGSLYALASRGIFPSDRKSALKTFNNIFKPRINPLKFLNIKINKVDSITDQDIYEAYKFLNYLDAMIFKEYEKSKK